MARRPHGGPTRMARRPRAARMGLRGCRRRSTPRAGQVSSRSVALLRDALPHLVSTCSLRCGWWRHRFRLERMASQPARGYGLTRRSGCGRRALRGRVRRRPRGGVSARPGGSSAAAALVRRDVAGRPPQRPGQTPRHWADCWAGYSAKGSSCRSSVHPLRLDGHQPSLVDFAAELDRLTADLAVLDVGERACAQVDLCLVALPAVRAQDRDELGCERRCSASPRPARRRARGRKARR